MSLTHSLYWLTVTHFYQLSVKLLEMHARMHINQKGIYYSACYRIALAFCLSLTHSYPTKFTHTTFRVKTKSINSIHLLQNTQFPTHRLPTRTFIHSSRFEINLFINDTSPWTVPNTCKFSQQQQQAITCQWFKHKTILS